MSFMGFGKLKQPNLFFPALCFSFNRHASATVGFEHQTTHVCEAKNLHSS